MTNFKNFELSRKGETEKTNLRNEAQINKLENEFLSQSAKNVQDFDDADFEYLQDQLEYFKLKKEHYEKLAKMNEKLENLTEKQIIEFLKI